MALRCEYDGLGSQPRMANRRQMTNDKRLCPKLVVRNEMANLERFPSAITEHRGCWIVGDSSSSDGGRNLIRSFPVARGVSGEPHELPFHDFGRTRNERRSAKGLA